MKYANIIFDGNRKTSYNIGDDLQLVAIENLYKYMGIAEGDIVRIPFSQLVTYDGEYVVLPIAFPLYGYSHDMYITMFSNKIIPVFLALSIMSGNLTDDEVVYLRRFEPIGCRDYHTMKLMQENNIMAYLNGCMTATLPRISNLKGEKVYFVDVPARYYQHIPEEIAKDAIVLSNVLDDCVDPEQEVKNRLKQYAENARLVVTTRLHVAMPCTAIGIPVVFMKDRYSFRFPFISRYIHVWEKEEFNNIDWNPKPVEYEDMKHMILDVAGKRITETYNKYQPIYDLSWFYEQNNLRKDYFVEHVDNVIEFIKREFSVDNNYEYAIWGVTQKADLICDFIEKERPNMNLKYVYDRSRKTEFHGLVSGNDVDKIKEKNVFVFVTAATANVDAMRIFGEINKTDYYISADDIDRLDRQ